MKTELLHMIVVRTLPVTFTKLFQMTNLYLIMVFKQPSSVPNMKDNTEQFLTPSCCHISYTYPKLPQTKSLEIFLQVHIPVICIITPDHLRLYKDMDRKSY